ncbi:hypothetical protein [Ruegeria arenilitoris]|uniref:hypothetical protein n=1 Tax=Ruegeria arenilitoris TaxID=1173585 RepID=UPI001481C03B|nr:hypothetical protein [Ruegeria arenilitoris]
MFLQASVSLAFSLPLEEKSFAAKKECWGQQSSYHALISLCFFGRKRKTFEGRANKTTRLYALERRDTLLWHKMKLHAYFAQ